MSFGAADPMDERKARALLGDTVRQDGALLSSHPGFAVAAGPRDKAARLEGMFNAEQLEAIAFMLRSRGSR